MHVTLSDQVLVHQLHSHRKVSDNIACGGLDINMAPSTAGLQYSKDEKVLCFHYAMLYEAKILDVKFDDGGQEARKPYKVHYKGWKNT